MILLCSTRLIHGFSRSSGLIYNESIKSVSSGPVRVTVKSTCMKAVTASSSTIMGCASHFGFIDHVK